MSERIAFAGTPEFARVALEALHAAGFEIALVLTQPDRPAGRGLKLQASPVKAFALDHGLALAQPRSLKLDGKYPLDAAQARIAIEAARADVMVVAAYGLILPAWMLAWPRLQGNLGGAAKQLLALAAPRRVEHQLEGCTRIAGIQFDLADQQFIEHARIEPGVLDGRVRGRGLGQRCTGEGRRRGQGEQRARASGSTIESWHPENSCYGKPILGSGL